jgi:hypothetical protein
VWLRADATAQEAIVFRTEAEPTPAAVSPAPPPPQDVTW